MKTLHYTVLVLSFLGSFLVNVGANMYGHVSKPRGFDELYIVVLILGIIAGVAVFKLWR